jgi:glycosyltransferase involved in cell wall biosynthesis
VGELPLVSVVTATYNWSSVLRQAIGCALRQTYPRLELIVVGDGCTDDSEEVVAGFADPRVRWHNLDGNSGSQSAPNNAGIELARGEYVAYLGHDDVWLPTHLAYLVDALVREQADVAFTVTEEIGPSGSRYRSLAGHPRVAGYRRAQWVPPSSLAHRRDLTAEIGPWRDYRTIRDPPDRELLIRAFDHGKRFAFVEALTVFKFNSAYRRNSYVEKPSHEQARYVARMAQERGFVYRELAALALAHSAALFRLPAKRLPKIPPAPDESLGWQVTQARRIRGLEPDAE